MKKGWKWEMRREMGKNRMEMGRKSNKVEIVVK